MKSSTRSSTESPLSQLRLPTSRRKTRNRFVIAVLHLGTLPIGVRLQRHLHINSKNLHTLRVGPVQKLAQAYKDALFREKKEPKWSDKLRSWGVYDPTRAAPHTSSEREGGRVVNVLTALLLRIHYEGISSSLQFSTSYERSGFQAPQISAFKQTLVHNLLSESMRLL